DIDLRSFVDPFANRRDLFRAQRSAAQWHPGAALAEDTPYHETLLAISWNDSRAVGASLNHLCPGAERQSCRRLRSDMAVQAARHQDGMNRCSEIDRLREGEGSCQRYQEDHIAEQF